MGKRIAFCADGTWDGTSNNTNVYKMSKAVLSVPGQQIVYYDDGVGADGNPIERTLGGAFGNGLFQKIKDGYSHIANVYEGITDEVFLFGFSRGAYTARSLAGMIAICGLPTKNPDPSLVDHAFEAYRNRDRRDAILASLGTYEMVDAKITMVGVWDTVGSLGIPALFGRVSPLIYGFLDTNLHPDVLHAYHALAIDERRAEFPATLWTSAPALGQTLEQVYFCGVHSDVGGGYADDPDSGTALSDITLGWIMKNAQRLGLQMDPGASAKYTSLGPKHALDTVHNSWSPAWAFPVSRSISPTACLANSVGIRCQEDGSYRPRNLKVVNGVPDPQYRIVNVV